MNKEIRGPAFPQYSFSNHVYVDGGMTLRDYFAIRVLPTLIANNQTDLNEDVRDAYMIADAMLKARER
jgi:hypothetical protein